MSVSDAGFDSEMIEYAAVVQHEIGEFMFYNGNNYGERDRVSHKSKDLRCNNAAYLFTLDWLLWMDAVDVFVILDIAQFDRDPGNSGIVLKTATGSMWLTVPVISKGQRSQSILETKIDTNQNFH